VRGQSLLKTLEAQITGITMKLLKRMRARLNDEDFQTFCLRLFDLSGVLEEDKLEFLAYINKQLEEKETVLKYVEKHPAMRVEK